MGEGTNRSFQPLRNINAAKVENNKMITLRVGSLELADWEEVLEAPSNREADDARDAELLEPELLEPAFPAVCVELGPLEVETVVEIDSTGVIIMKEVADVSMVDLDRYRYKELATDAADFIASMLVIVVVVKSPLASVYWVVIGSTKVVVMS